MNDDFIKFPSTKHLIALSDLDIRKDKIMSEPERKEFLKYDLIVEEKIDGSNLGISFDSEGNIRLQKRGGYINYAGEWKKLDKWIDNKIDALFDILSDKYIMFGEWCYAKHSIFYDELPDWFLGFDVYDKQNEYFLSTTKRNNIFKKINIHQVPFLTQGKFDLDKLRKFLVFQSEFGNTKVEGIYLRIDEQDRLIDRSKIVNGWFRQSIESHWNNRIIKLNEII